MDLFREQQRVDSDKQGARAREIPARATGTQSERESKDGRCWAAESEMGNVGGVMAGMGNQQIGSCGMRPSA